MDAGFLTKINLCRKESGVKNQEPRYGYRDRLAVKIYLAKDLRSF